MYQVIDTHTGKILSEDLTFRTAEIKRNARCFTAQDSDRFQVRYVTEHPLVAFMRQVADDSKRWSR